MQHECLVPMQSQRPRLFSRSALSKLTVISSGSAVHTSVNQIGMWELGGQATAAAKTSGKGGAYQGAVSLMPGVWMYQRA